MGAWLKIKQTRTSRACRTRAAGIPSTAMRSTELTREQLERMERDVERHHRYYLKLGRRAQANDMALHDPFVRRICRAWDGINQLAQTIERMKNQLPQHYRPLAKPTKRSGLAERDLPWAEKQRQAAAAVETRVAADAPR